MAVRGAVQVLLWAPLTYAGFAYAGIQSILIEAVEQLPVELRTVQTCGNWKHGSGARRSPCTASTSSRA